MALEIKLSQKLSQSLIMTPQLQQAIKLLQLGRVEYLEVLEKEMMENPMLEDGREEGATAESPAAELPRDAESLIENVSEKPAAESGAERELLDLEEKAAARRDEDAEWVSYYDLYADSTGSSFGPVRRGDFDDERPSLESSISKPEGLTSHLLWQLRTSELPEDCREIAFQIIGNLDHNGYLSSPLEDLGAECRCSAERVEKVLKIIQTLDPAGVGARDLRECLLIQLDQLGLSDSLSARIVEKHLDKLEVRRYDQIAREEGVDVENVYEALRQIQKLEPRPGRPFVDEAPVYITPDIYVRKVENEWVISLNEAGMPKLRLSPRYRDLLRNGNGDLQGKEYLQDKVRSAAWLIRSVHQRQQTIYRVAESIMRFQREFLESGVSGLRPLVLRDVADDVKMHESTISRVTTNKYIHTPHGVFELKFFFSSGLRTGDGEISSESVKEQIREMVSAEDPAQPLSDQAIVEKLKANGVEIARRTVAKYREMMGVLSSSRRKKVF